MNKNRVLGALAVLIVALHACGKKEEQAAAPESPPATAPAPAPEPAPAPAGVTVSTITLGNAIADDKKVTQASDSFAKNDTVYAAVETTGAGTATLKARWTYHQDGKEALVNEETQTITATGPATSEFHISKPDGWPAGNYQVAILVDEQPAGTKTFTVK